MIPFCFMYLPVMPVAQRLVNLSNLDSVVHSVKSGLPFHWESLELIYAGRCECVADHKDFIVVHEIKLINQVLVGILDFLNGFEEFVCVEFVVFNECCDVRLGVIKYCVYLLYSLDGLRIWLRLSRR